MNFASVEPQALDLSLPWVVDVEQEERLKRYVKRILIPLLLLLFIVPWLPTMEAEYVAPDSDDKKTKIMLKPVIIETPVPEPVKPKATPKPKPTPKPATPPPEPPKVQNQPTSNTPPKSTTEKKDSVAEAAGLKGLSDQLSSLRSLNMKTLNNKNVTSSNAGKVRSASKSTLGENINQRSSGVDMENLQLSDEKVQLAMHKASEMDGFVAGDGGSPEGDKNSRFYSAIKGMRSNESIRRSLEAGKSRAVFLYQAQVRLNPGLEGVLQFEMVVEPGGHVSSLRVVSSELEDPDLEERILNVIRAIDFGAQDVAPRKVIYTFNFFPT